MSRAYIEPLIESHFTVLRELFGAIDENKNGYYAIVIGDADAVNRAISKIPKGFTHMTRYHADSDKRRKIIDDIDLSGNILVYCVKFNIPELKRQVDIRRAAGSCKMPSEKVNNKIGYTVVREIQKLFRVFLVDNGVDRIRDISFEVDNMEVHNYVKNGGLQTTFRSKNVVNIHTIADCIAYTNYRGWGPKDGIVEMHYDFQEKFQKDLIKEITKK